MAACASQSRSAPRIYRLLPGVQNMEGTTITSMNAHFEADKHNPRKCYSLCFMKTCTFIAIPVS
jgi:hypothetical protein